MKKVLPGKNRRSRGKKGSYGDYRGDFRIAKIAMIAQNAKIGRRIMWRRTARKSATKKKLEDSNARTEIREEKSGPESMGQMPILTDGKKEPLRRPLLHRHPHKLL
jgi:hypothetical protein